MYTRRKYNIVNVKYWWYTYMYDTYVHLKIQKYNVLINYYSYRHLKSHVSLILLHLTDFSSLISSFIISTNCNHINIRAEHEGRPCLLRNDYLEIALFVLYKVFAPCYFGSVYWNYTKIIQKYYAWPYYIHITFLILYPKYLSNFFKFNT